MKKLFALLLFLPSAAFADIKQEFVTSAQITVDMPYVVTNKVGTTYSLSGNNITTTDSNSAATIGGFGSVTSGTPAISFPSSVTQATSGEAFSFSTSYLEGDATSGSAPTVGTVSNFSDLTSTSAGSVGTAAVSLDNHTMTLSAGTGTGVVLTGQFVTDLTVD